MDSVQDQERGRHSRVANNQPPSVSIHLISYGHAYGPLHSEILSATKQHKRNRVLSYNIRHLPNPPRSLRTSGGTGLSRRLRTEFLKNKPVQKYLERVGTELLDTIREEVDGPHHDIEQEDSGKGDDIQDIGICIAVCCEEGRHRSVALIEELAFRIQSPEGEFRTADERSLWTLADLDITHRDLHRSYPPTTAIQNLGLDSGEADAIEDDSHDGENSSSVDGSHFQRQGYVGNASQRCRRRKSRFDRSKYIGTTAYAGDTDDDEDGI